MKIAKVTAGFSCKVTKNYNSVEAHVELEAELEAGENAECAIAALHEQAKAAVKRQLIGAGVANGSKIEVDF